MRNTFKLLSMLAASVVGCALFTNVAQAAYIDGSIEFTGAAKATTSAGVTTISFTNPWKVFADDGSYSSVPANTSATFNTVKYTGSGATATLVAPVAPQWTFTYSGVTYSFDLEALDNAFTSSSSMSLSGSGTAHITGFTPTSASWALQGSGTSFTFRFSSSTTTAIPDGGTCVAMLGFALVGVEGLRRKLRK